MTGWQGSPQPAGGSNLKIVRMDIKNQSHTRLPRTEIVTHHLISFKTVGNTARENGRTIDRGDRKLVLFCSKELILIIMEHLDTITWLGHSSEALKLVWLLKKLG